jgi:DNA-directed RNA polymerase specialized sigma subunit
MSNNALNNNIEKALNNRDYQKVMQKATNKFRRSLDPDTLETCQLHGLWHSLENFDPSYNVKFTTFLFKGVFIECVKAAKFQKRHMRYSASKMHDNIPSNNKTDIELVDLQDEIDNASDPEMLRERASGNTISEISETRSISRETVRKRLKKMSRTIQRRYL